MQVKPKWNTIVEALLAVEGCANLGARFVKRSGQESFHSYQEVIARAKSVAGTLQAGGLCPGDRVAIVAPTSIQFFDSFLGVQLAGGIPAALYPPFRLGKLTEYFARTRRMLSLIGAKFLITESRVRKLLGPAVSDVDCVKRVFDADSLLASDRWRRVDVDPDAPAFLQFSSGSTSDPKAVIVSHTNLLFNLEMMDRVFQTFPEGKAENGGVCWLPLYHDMGLVGCLFNGLYHPGTVTYIGPEQFITKPSFWLQIMSRYKAAASPAPHFAYSLCARKIKDAEMEGVDLSNWLLALNGAEPIEVEAMQRFAGRFARWGFRPEAMTPVYGLAEAGLAVTFSDPHAAPLVTEFDRDALSVRGSAVEGIGRKLPSVGRPMPGLELEIWDTEGNRLGQGDVGRIMVRGPSITSGYYNDPGTTRRAIDNGWLDTGDLGFLHRDELYIAGRAKDLIIVRGRNYAPQEVEELVAEVEGVRTGCCVAVSQPVGDMGEQLLVLAEKDIRSQRPEAETALEIGQRIASGIGLTPYHVQMLEPGTLPRTSSGKLRRSDALQMFVSGQLLPPENMGTLRLLKELGKSQLAWGRFWLRDRSAQ